MNCSTCNARTDTRSARKAHGLATGHDAFVPAIDSTVAAPVIRTARDERVDAMVADGFSREFAEAYIPMTSAEACARGLVIPGFRSELTGLIR